MTQNIPLASIGLARANHVGIVVSDLDAAIRFYEALTGKTIANKVVIGGPGLAAVQGLDEVVIRYGNVYLDNLNIDPLQHDEPSPKSARYSGNDISAMHLYFEVDDLEAVYQRMAEAGLTLNGEPITFQAEYQLKQGIGTTVAYFDDPDGIHLEIIQPKGSFQRKGHEGP